MSFNTNHIISLQNYEEWFVLYLDNELTAAKRKEVEDFLLLHPQLQEEMDLLQSTRLPVEQVIFSGKAELLAASMKMNTVDEALLLYVDNELPAAEYKKIDDQLRTDNDFRLQYELLQKTKLDSADVVSYPDRKELYRHSEKRVIVPVWMRIAAAVVLLLTGSYLFMPNESSNSVQPTTVAVIQKQTPPVKPSVPESPVPTTVVSQPQKPIVARNAGEKTGRGKQKDIPVSPVEKKVVEQLGAMQQSTEALAVQEWEPVQIDVKKLTTKPAMPLNNSVANLRVTSVVAAAYNLTEDPEETAVTAPDFRENNRTPAKGFLRKVSRFIERRTGIGTVNADNELLVGAVALKLN